MEFYQKIQVKQLFKNFKLVSIKDNVEKFGSGYYPEPFNTS